ncbi:thermonuclease family protein [Natrialba aegyptia]|nr:thermonuclease family protein [Natrialba aegyptia]
MGENPTERRSTVGRRNFMAVTGTAVGTALTGIGTRPAVGTSTAEPGIEALSFYSAASQIAPDGESELSDDETVVVWAEPTAYNFETTDDGPSTVVYETNDIPLVSEDGSVVGLGTVEFISDDQGGFDVGNEEFMLNLFDAKIGGEGTVLWDEGHDQFHELALEHYHSFEQYAANAGYELRSTTDILGGAQLLFPSTASQVAAGGGPLTDPAHVLVWAEPTAENVDDEGDSASYLYGEDEAIPLVSRDEAVVGFGTPELLQDGDLTESNEQFVRNLLSETIGESGTILWDDAHDSYYDSSSFGEFAAAIEDDGYDFEATEDLLGSDGGGIDELEFFSTASLLDADGESLTDDSLVAVWAESTAENVDENDDGFVSYAGVDADVPLVAVDGTVVGIGAPLATDESDVDATREFLVTAWEDRLDGPGTVYYDESHGQALALDDYAELEALASNRGFDVGATDDLAADLDDADLVMITSPGEAFSAAERDALEAFVADGGAVFIHDEADYDGHATDTLNVLAAALDLDFRFNSDQVVDEEHSDWAPFVLRTTNVNDAFEFFDGSADGATIDAADAVVVPSPGEEYTEPELDALSAHVAGGGAVFLLDESEFTNEETATLNAIAAELDIAFRFNADQVEDETHNDGVAFVPTTANFNDGFDVFDGVGAPGLDEADGLVVSSPSTAFSQTELDELEAFVADGGALFLFDESDFGGQGNSETGFDETANLNAIADALDLDFRFNSDQVNDGDGEFDIETTNLNTAFDYFAEREESIGIEFDPGEEYYGRVVRVFDGDTVEVEFDSEYDYRDVVRHLGFDTAETGDVSNEIHEWFGVEDIEHLNEWGENATAFALDVMTPDGTDAGDTDVEGRRIKLTFDDVEPIRGNYGRLLGYMHYDPDDFDADPGTGDYSVEYNRQMVAEGYARVYSSGFGRHDEFAAVEEAALADGRGVWSAADFDAVLEHRNDPVEEVYVPRASSITTDSGPLAADRVPVAAGPDADQEPLSGSSVDAYDEAPLIGVDHDNRVAMAGGLLFNEAYEELEGFPVDTGGYGNFPLVTNLARYLSHNDGDFLVEGGHAQFDVSGSLSLERMQYYLRFVEGIGGRLRQFNDVATTLPEADEPTAVFLTAPGRAYTEAELGTLREFRDDGGAVILVGSTAASADHRANLDAVAAGLGSDLRLNDDRIVDTVNNLAGEAVLPVTSTFNRSYPLFSPVGDDAFGHLDPQQRAYLELLANDEGFIIRPAVDGAIEDWSAGRIDRETLDAAVLAWEREHRVIAP